MNTNTLFFRTAPIVTLATNTFINVPVILKYEEINLIEIVKELELGYTTSIPIFHPDGTYLAKVKGTRIFATEDGEKAGLIINKNVGVTECRMGKRTLFEIRHGKGDAFKTIAELYTNDGYFVKCNDEAMPMIQDNNNQFLNIRGLFMSHCTFSSCRVGIWFRKDGSFSIG